MDPNSSVEGFNFAVADSEWDDAIMYLEALTGWISGGGFMPRSAKLELPFALPATVWDALTCLMMACHQANQRMRAEL